MQTFTAPLATSYKIQCWGASGGNSYEWDKYTNTVYGGKGGYCSGWIAFPSNFNINIYVGQSGENLIVRTFNGGGIGVLSYDAYSGGGATDIRLTGGTWSEFSSLKTRILVAAGGGGAQHYYAGSNGGYAGGLSGQDGSYSVSPSGTHSSFKVATGATQISGGKVGNGGYGIGHDGIFGIGGDPISYNNGRYDRPDGSGGGGGYYGGGGAGYGSSIVGSGAGGSSFISGYLGCDAIAESSTEDNIIHTGQPNHYSGYVFSNPVMIDGGSTMPSPSGGTETGHSGNGYCIITWQQLPQ